MGRQEKTTKRRRGLYTIASAVLVLVIVNVILLFNISTPVARTSDGKAVKNPYCMMVDGKETMLVASEQDGKDALESAVSTYVPEGTVQKKVVYDKNIEFKEKEIKPFKKVNVVLTEEEATEKILESNRSDDPLFTATITAEESTKKTVKPKVDFEFNKDMKMFEYKVKKEGEEGSKQVTYEVTSSNGDVVAKEKTEAEIIKEAVNAVVETGHEEAPEDLRWEEYDDYQDEIEEESKDVSIGEQMIEFGLKHLGAPYKRGASNFETGIDCGNFVVEVYKKFGIEVSRSIPKQSRTGKSVTLEEARPGDIVYYGNHVALYMGDGKVIHARKKGLTTDNINYRKWISIRHIEKNQ